MVKKEVNISNEEYLIALQQSTQIQTQSSFDFSFYHFT